MAIAPLSVAIACRKTLHPAACCVLLQTAASGLSVSIAASKPLQCSTTSMLGKVCRWTQPDDGDGCSVTQDPVTGRFPWWSWVLFWPYHVSLRLLLRLKQLKNAQSEPLWNCVTKDQQWYACVVAMCCRCCCATPSWFHRYIGGWPSSTSQLPRGGNVAVVDVTAELPATARGLAYRCLPVWDTTAPTARQIAGAATWALEQRRAGRAVLVHCAHGHGRSCVVLCAILVAAGVCQDEREALRLVRAQRPGARLNAHQTPGLQQFLQTRHNALPNYS